MTRNAAKFTLAHKMTQAIRELHPTADYRVTFGACLREINRIDNGAYFTSIPGSQSIGYYLDEAECGFESEGDEAEFADCAIAAAAPPFNPFLRASKLAA